MIDGMATLQISSALHPAYYVTTVLGLEPDWSAEKGDPRPRQGDTGTEPIRRPVYDTSMWALEVESDPGTKMAVVEDDAKGFATLQVLADRLLGRGPALAQIKADYTVELTWYGTAAGSVAGFMLPSTLVRDLAELGLDVSCTVYGHDDTSERPGLHAGADSAGVKRSGQQLTPDQLAARAELEQQTVDRMIAQQLAEQRVADEALAADELGQEQLSDQQQPATGAV